MNIIVVYLSLQGTISRISNTMASHQQSASLTDNNDRPLSITSNPFKSWSEDDDLTSLGQSDVTHKPTKTCSSWLFQSSEVHKAKHQTCWFLCDCDEFDNPIGWIDNGDGSVSTISETIKSSDDNIVYKGPLLRHFKHTDDTWEHQALSSDRQWLSGSFDMCLQLAYSTKQIMQQ